MIAIVGGTLVPRRTPVTVEDLEKELVGIASDEVGSTDWRRYQHRFLPGTTRLSWCGLFLLWCIDELFLRHGQELGRRWIIARGIYPALPIIPLENARRGDGLYMHANNHYALMRYPHGVGSAGLHSIDGNVSGYSGASCVAFRTRPVAAWAAALDVHPDLERLADAINGGHEIMATNDNPLTHPLPRVVSVTRSKGSAWEQVQRELQEAGYYHGRIDGDPGPLTCTAIVEERAMREEKAPT